MRRRRRQQQPAQQQLYRPPSPPPPEPNKKEGGAACTSSTGSAGRKRRSPRYELAIGGACDGGDDDGYAYMAGPINFPPEDASDDEVWRWFLRGQMRDDDDNTASNNNKDGDKEGDKAASNNDKRAENVGENRRRLEARRRAENRRLAALIDSGGARIDADGRIVPTNRNADDTNVGDGEEEGAEHQDGAVNGDNRNGSNGPTANDDGNGDTGNIPLLDANDDARFAPTVGLLHPRPPSAAGGGGIRNFNLNDDDVEFIPLPGSAAANAASANGRGGNRNDAPWAPWGRLRRRRQQQQQQPRAGPRSRPNALEPPPVVTFRRVCCAVFAVVTAFVCIMLQTLPLLEGGGSDRIDPVLDPVLRELVVLRDVADHFSSCGVGDGDNNLHRKDQESDDDDKSNGEVHQGADGPDDLEATTSFLNRREAWASIVALYLHSLDRLQHCVQVLRSFTQSSHRRLTCQDGVIHIPSVSVLKERYEEALIRDHAWKYPNEWPSLQDMTEAEKAEAQRLKEIHAPYKDGVDLAWPLPCVGHAGRNVGSDLAHNDVENRASTCPSAIDPASSDCARPTLAQRFKRKFSSSDISSGNDTCIVDPTPETQKVCFRGVSDGVITQAEVDVALLLASNLIANGGDHLEIRRDVHVLRRYLPSVLGKVEGRFRDRHGVACRLEPVAFRIFAALPMEGEPLSTPLAGSIHSKYVVMKQRAQLTGAVNHTVYYESEAANRDRNDRAPFHLLRTLSAKRPFRDPCVLMSDRQRSPDFSFHSSIFLSDGAGGDHSGGTELYADAHRRNKNPRRRIQRGTIIDPSRGRLVLSSGGDENKHCKMPMRAGIRAVLQIWWDCG